MKLWSTGLLLAGAVSLPVGTWAQHAATTPPPPTPHRGGALFLVDWGAGGDSIYDLTGTKLDAGDGIGVSIGGFYRPMEHSPLEIQGFVGYRFGILMPMAVGNYSNTERVVLQLMANYRFNNKWYVAGGLVHHANVKIVNDAPGGQDFDLGSSTGVTVEAGYSFIGAYYTYMNYSVGQYGDLDASSVGLRFTIRFRKWHPVL